MKLKKINTRLTSRKEGVQIFQNAQHVRLRSTLRVVCEHIHVSDMVKITLQAESLRDKTSRVGDKVLFNYLHVAAYK